VDDSGENSENVQFVLNSIAECDNAISKSRLNGMKSVVFFYKHCKRIVYQIDKIYKQSEVIYLPYLINRLDKLTWYIYVTVFNFIKNLPPIKKGTQAVTRYIIMQTAKQAAKMMTQLDRNTISSRDKRQVVNTLSKIENNMNIKEEELSDIVKVLAKKIRVANMKEVAE
jgi:hypothetical protein